MSIHKNYIEGYGREWNKLCNERLIPYQDQIFKLFSEKFHTDAEKDGERGRKLLKLRGNKCSDLCNQIHEILQGTDNINIELKKQINDIVNLDYNSLLEIFQVLRNEYDGNSDVSKYIDDICLCLGKMWKISKPHTTIQNK